ncbi:nucleotidyltransferase family protein [Halomonas campisalis]|uniref:Nucleotidyltransferase family protein n=1 Tax=Billgrantia campisalis TaxID=74661 RepID=A0ABS9PCA6_9GAMM|nr:nucleotidyltransferase family protein [Halomonas campisalis]MCG6659346.1 nucleotidyltransferase family protein [Halomonas campisalis]MDR5863948.1 nucleotidyltransferase family protein [Halomonas campisalis]
MEWIGCMEATMIIRRLETLQLLQQRLPDMVREFGVRDLALFGSMARDEAEAGSDVDILVIFDGPATADRYFGLQFYLEDLLGRPVDLVTDKALRPELRPYIESEAMHV